MEVQILGVDSKREKKLGVAEVLGRPRKTRGQKSGMRRSSVLRRPGTEK
jgi:hypothetical protein